MLQKGQTARRILSGLLQEHRQWPAIFPLRWCHFHKPLRRLNLYQHFFEFIYGNTILQSCQCRPLQFIEPAA